MNVAFNLCEDKLMGCLATKLGAILSGDYFGGALSCDDRRWLQGQTRWGRLQVTTFLEQVSLVSWRIFMTLLLATLQVGTSLSTFACIGASSFGGTGKAKEVKKML